MTAPEKRTTVRVEVAHLSLDQARLAASPRVLCLELRKPTIALAQVPLELGLTFSCGVHRCHSRRFGPLVGAGAARLLRRGCLRRFAFAATA